MAARMRKLRRDMEERKALQSAPPPTNEMLLQASIGTRPNEVSTESVDELMRSPVATGTTVEHKRQRRVMLYDEFGRGRVVPSGNLAALLRAGLRAVCPYCSGAHKDTGFNACPVKEPLAYTQCNVCAQHGRSKLIADKPIPDVLPVVDPTDPNFVPLKDDFGGTVEERLRARLNDHMLVYHPAESRARGIHNPP